MDGLQSFGGLAGCFGFNSLGYASTPQQLQAAMGAQAMQRLAQQQAPQPTQLQQLLMQQRCGTPAKRKKVESKIIETVEIRPKQDIKLLKAGKGL